jgi:hypothetical protein
MIADKYVDDSDATAAHIGNNLLNNAESVLGP